MSSQNSTIKTVLICIAGFVMLLIVSLFLWIHHSRLPSTLPRIAFSAPMIAIVDSTEWFIFDENTPERYRTTCYYDMLSEVKRRDSNEIIYSVNPKYKNAMFVVDFWRVGNLPNYLDEESVEQYYPCYRVGLSRIDFKVIPKMFLGDEVCMLQFLSLFGPSYVNILPDEFVFDIVDDDPSMYSFFISLKNKPSVLMFAEGDSDCPKEDFMNHADNISYWRKFIIDTSQKKLSGEDIGFKLGEYDVWQISNFAITDYKHVLYKSNSYGEYSDKLVICQ